MKKLIIFDFDGVIVDSEQPRIEVFKEILNRRHLPLSNKLLKKLIGKPGRNFIEDYYFQISESEKEQILLEYKDIYLDHAVDFLKPISLVVDFIKNYHGNCIFAIGSMSTKDLIVKILDKLQLRNYFQLLVTRENIIHHKPNPEVYSKIASTLNLSPQECLVIEDTKIGAQAAVAAGMDCCVLLNRYNRPSEFKDVQITGFIKSDSDFNHYL